MTLTLTLTPTLTLTLILTLTLTPTPAPAPAPAPTLTLAVTLTRRAFCDADAYCTVAGVLSSASLGWHVDDVDVLLVMCRGRKRFRVAGRGFGSPVVIDTVLEPGDALYIPCATPLPARIRRRLSGRPDHDPRTRRRRTRRFRRRPSPGRPKSPRSSTSVLALKRAGWLPIMQLWIVALVCP